MRQIMGGICILAGIFTVGDEEVGWFVCGAVLLLSKISSQLDDVISKLDKK